MVDSEFQQPKWLILLFMCLCCSASNYIYDFPGVLGVGSSHSIQAVWIESGQNYTQSMNQGLYASYSIPNCVGSVLGGIIIDKFLMLRLSTVLFALVYLLGSSTFYVGLCWTSYAMLVAGRILLGFGCECLVLAQSAWVSRWFKGQWGFALAYGLAIAFQRFGAWLNFFFSPRIVAASNLHLAVFVGVITAAASALLATATSMWDSHQEAKGAVCPIAGFKARPPLHLGEIRRLPVTFWCLACVAGMFWAVLLGFIGVGSEYLTVKFGFPSDTASSLMSIYPLVVAVATPLVGMAVDRLGRNGYFIVLAGALLAAALLLLALLPASVSAVPLLVLLGISFSAVGGSLFPCVPLVVEAEQLGIAYGLITSSIATLNSIARVVAGTVLDAHTAAKLPGGTAPPLPTMEGFRILLLFLGGLSSLATCVALFMCALDRRNPLPQASANTLGTLAKETSGIINASASLRRMQ
jgi:MFS family permease